MTRIGRRLIEDFLLPALNDGRYGDLLKWVDRDKCYFSIRWSHKNAAKWTLDDTAVFQDWDKLKGHYRPEIKGYYMQAKQRFRAALYKLNTVRKLPCDDKHVKKYQLVLNQDKRHRAVLSRKIYPKWLHKEENQKSIPTPVICRNTSFIAKSEPEESCSSPPSPIGSIKCEMDEVEECLEDYQMAREKQLKLSSELEHKKVKCEPLDCPSLVLRESPQNNIVRRTPHVPIQPVPVYSSKSIIRQAIESAPPKRFESPHVLLVQTYNDTDMDNIPPIKVEREENILNSDKSCSENENGALNLSVKSDDSIVYSR